MSTPGLEFASHMQKTTDGVMYVAEPEINSISTWVHDAEGMPSFQDRRSNGEVRLRFRGLQDVEVDPLLLSVEGRPEPHLQGVRLFIATIGK